MLDSNAPLPFINPDLKRQKKRGPVTKSRNRPQYCTDVYVSDTPDRIRSSQTAGAWHRCDFFLEK